MAANEWKQRIVKGLKRYRYVILILLLGVGILLLPSSNGEKTAAVTVQETPDSDREYAAQVEHQLEELLSMVEGAGQVRVMLTLQSGSRTEYQADEETVQNGEQKSQERKTVILSGGSAYDKAAVSTVEYPRFQGALILSQGAQRPAVCLDLINAVAALTGLSTSQITVVKMK